MNEYDIEEWGRIRLDKSEQAEYVCRGKRSCERCRLLGLSLLLCPEKVERLFINIGESEMVPLIPMTRVLYRMMCLEKMGLLKPDLS